MTTYSQDGRDFRVESPLGKDKLLLHAFHGVEAVSAPFEFTVDLLSTDARIDGKGLLRKPLSLHITGSQGDERVVHGLVRRFTQLGRHEELVSYRAEIVPWFWFLKLSRDCRIFQEMTPVAIIEKIVKEFGFSDQLSVRSEKGATRTYCVQYRETHFDFISRLMEEEGIYYFFQHEAGKHTLVLADKPSEFKTVAGQSKAEWMAQPGKFHDADVITNLERDDAIHTDKVTVRGWDPLQPTLMFEGTEADGSKAEAYDYPGWFTRTSDAQRVAKRLLQHHASMALSVRGISTMRSFVPGYKFDLERHYRSDANGSYTLLRVEHRCQAGDFRTWDQKPPEYDNTFLAIPASTPYRPVPATARPVVQGSQTAIVVGPAGEEIYVDKYGRVKVQFHWDREGKKDDKSSCWVRVSSTWAGKGWGAIQLPRVGQEVIVDFLEGDPDQPIITGRVYNAEQMVPYGLPANMTQSGVISRSSKGGTSANYNEIRFEDKKGSELLHLHAEKDETHDVENDRTRTVGHDESVSVGNNQSISVQKDRTRDVGDNETVSIGKNQTLSVGDNQSLSVEKNRTKSVGKDESTDIGASRTESVGKDETITISGNRTESVGKDEKISVTGARSTSIGKDDVVEVGKKFALTAGDEIVLKTGSASITMKKNGDIVIKGANIKLEASGKIEGKASGTVTLKGSTIGQN